MLSPSTHLVVKNHDRGPLIQCVTSIGPEIRFMRFAFSRTKLLDRRFIGMDDRSLEKIRLQLFPKWRQVKSGPSHPVPQGRLRQRHPVSRRDLLDSIERKVISEFADQNPRQKPRAGHAAFDQRGGNGNRRHCLTGAARVLGTNVAMNGELGGLNIELLRHVLADLDQALPALAARTDTKVMNMINSGQMRRQGLATRAREAYGPFSRAGWMWLRHGTPALPRRDRYLRRQPR